METVHVDIKIICGLKLEGKIVKSLYVKRLLFVLCRNSIHTIKMSWKSRTSLESKIRVPYVGKAATQKPFKKLTSKSQKTKHFPPPPPPPAAPHPPALKFSYEMLFF